MKMFMIIIQKKEHHTTNQKAHMGRAKATYSTDLGVLCSAAD